ncbi:DUF4870 domain-containing protein [Marinisporobacter balticus]|nr:DUF4870 domain-containing protein [Marinisporobacter balticus]
MLTTEQKLLCGIAHLGWMVGFPVLAPIVIMLLTGDIFIRNQAKEALIFQIGMIVLGAIFGVLSFVLIGIPFLILIWGAGLIFPIIAVIRICDGIDYSYPITGKFVR